MPFCDLLNLMGNVDSHSNSSKEQRQINSKIETQMKKDELMEKRTVKLLLLGAGESGKSTVLKQMRILHDQNFTEQEYRHHASIVFWNVLQSLSILLKAMEQLQIPYDNPARKNDEDLLREHIDLHGDSVPLPYDTVCAVKRLWADKGVQLCYHRSAEYQLNYSAKYFLDDIERICLPNYVPTQEDILRTRVRTTGIVEVKFDLKGLTFRVFDSGGQRSERKKWIRCFEGVQAIIFVSAVSEYDQLLAEDGKTNRVVESLHLFDSISNSIWFTDSNIILFLNKKDIFAEKIRNVPLSVCFVEYAGGHTYDETINFMRKKFSSLYRNESKTLWIHETCATDSTQIQFVLDSTLDIIAKRNIEDCGLLT